MIVENHISSKIIYDLDTFHSDYQISYEQDLTIIKGKAPVRYLMTYQKDFLSLTKGNGKLFYQMAGYFECHDQEKIIQEIGYNSEEDALFPTVFYLFVNRVQDFMSLMMK